MDRSVSLKVNGQDIRLNAFVQKVLAGTVTGLVSSLDGLPSEVRDIQISIRSNTEEVKN